MKGKLYWIPFLFLTFCSLDFRGIYTGPTEDLTVERDDFLDLLIDVPVEPKDDFDAAGEEILLDVEHEYPLEDPVVEAEGDAAEVVDDEAGDAAVEDMAEEEVPHGPWLDAWAKRVRLVIDHNDADDDFYDFPVLVFLGNASGRSGDDVTFVFDELQNDGDRKKMAVTMSDAETQCYVELERWTSAGRQAWLWVKVPFVSKDADTVLYLYYDDEQPENTAYVGDTGSTAAENVWNSAYKGVWHLVEGGGSEMLDSTANNNNGRLNRTDNWTASGYVDGAYDFDGDDDWAECGSDPSLRPVNAVTLEGWLHVRSFGSWNAALAQQWDNGGDEAGYWIGSEEEGGPLVWWVHLAGSGWIQTSYAADTGRWYYVAGTYNGSQVKLYIDGNEEDSADAGGTINYDPMPYAFYMAWYHDSNEDFKMNVVVDEARVSDGARNAAWIRAGYESARDDLIDFDSEENY